MQKVDYIVTFMGDYPCGGRHPLTVKTKSVDVSGAISAATESIVDDRIKATNLVLISVVPDSFPPATDNVNSDGLLKPCPFCGNPNVSLVAKPCLKMVTKICTSLTVAVATLPSCLTANSEPSMTGTSVTWRAAVENNAFVPAGSVELAHQQALEWVCDAYLFYLVSMHRRPVYRHQYGDISLNQPAIRGFIDSYLKDKGWDLEKRRAHYINILDLIKYMHRSSSDFIDWGTVPALTPRGIQWMNACFSRLGEMVSSYGGWEGYKTAAGEELLDES